MRRRSALAGSALAILLGGVRQLVIAGTPVGELVLREQYIDAAAAESHRQSEHYQRIVASEIAPLEMVRERLARIISDGRTSWKDPRALNRSSPQMWV